MFKRKAFNAPRPASSNAPSGGAAPAPAPAPSSTQGSMQEGGPPADTAAVKRARVEEQQSKENAPAPCDDSQQEEQESPLPTAPVPKAGSKPATQRTVLPVPRPPASQPKSAHAAKLTAAAGKAPAKGAPPAHAIKPAAAASPAGGEENMVYLHVLYTKQDQYFKKKKAKVFVDGVLALSRTTKQGTLYEKSTSKPVWQGIAKQVSGPGAAGAAKQAFERRKAQMNQSKNPRKKSKKQEEEDDDDEDDEGATVIYELNSNFAEVDSELDPASFRSGECFVSPGRSTKPVLGAPSQGLTQAKTFQAPVLQAGAGALPAPAAQAPKQPRFLHDPHAQDALVLNQGQWASGSGLLPDGRPVTPVVVDPYLSKHLRPHQVEGVQFMYRSTMDAGSFQGCILADEMGLGKTLQVITLIWTLLRQGPTGKAAVRKVIVVVPATLVKQWVKEVQKWLGRERLEAVALMQGPEAADALADFRTLNNYQRNGLIVTSYEALRRYGKDLEGCCDLLICDEAHRLKSLGGNKTVNALHSLGCNKRILLTGTPVQNNLDEFYALLSFVAPGVLGTAGVFKRVYSDPISKGRDKNASQDERALGEDRSRELSSKVAAFVLRRTQDLLVKHLPPLSQFVVFCKPSELQVGLYRQVLHQATHGPCSMEDNSLALICYLKKLCNSPALLLGRGAAGEEGEEALEPGMDRATGKSLSEWVAGLPRPAGASEAKASGKLECLSQLLSSLTALGQRCVVVSTSTAALDLIGSSICQGKGYRVVRIDGSTNIEERQNIVDNFNLRGVGQVFMLSTRAGGAGLNLTGANNLVLYDSDWNPAADLQAMARIWRDGQKLPCNVYRFLTTGTIEEKVYQRQIMKVDLAQATIDGGNKGAGFDSRSLTRQDLKKLFILAEDSVCETRDLLEAGASDHQPLQWLDLEGGANGGVGTSASVAASPSMGPLAAAVATGVVTAVGRIVKGGAAAAAEVRKAEAEAEKQGGDGGAEVEEGSGGGDECEGEEEEVMELDDE